VSTYAKAQLRKLRGMLLLLKEDYMHLQLQEEVLGEIFSLQQGAFFELPLRMLGVYFLKLVDDLVENFQSFACEIVSNLLSQKTENALFQKEDLEDF
jgi:hypothetical protein